MAEFLNTSFEHLLTGQCQIALLHLDITANVQAAAQDIPVRAVVFVTSLLHCLRHDFFTFQLFWHCNMSLKFI